MLTVVKSMVNAEKMTDDIFQGIYENERLLKQVADSESCFDVSGEFLGYKTISYPISYFVSLEQKEIANKEMERLIKERIENLEKGTLLFTGIRTGYKTKYIGDIGNYEISTDFMNLQGEQYRIGFRPHKSLNSVECTTFLELASIGEDYRIYVSSDKSKINLALTNCLFTKESIIHLINIHFGCNYTKFQFDKNLLVDRLVVCECLPL